MSFGFVLPAAWIPLGAERRVYDHDRRRQRECCARRNARTWISVLEIRATTASDQERVTGKHRARHEE